MKAEAKEQNARGKALRKCPRCRIDAVLPSSAYGFKEEVLFLLGASLYRCHSCEARHGELRGWAIPLGDPTEDKTPYVVFAAILTGLMVCVAVALWTLRRAHRWPF